MSASAAAARPMASTLVAASIGSVRGRRIGHFNDHAALDAIVTGVGYVQVALAVDDDAIVVEELARIGTVGDAALAGCATRRILVNWSPVWSKLDHPPVVGVRDIHDAVA